MDRTEVFVKEGAHGFEVDRHDMDTFIVWGGGGGGGWATMTEFGSIDQWMTELWQTRIVSISTQDGLPRRKRK